MSYLAEGTTAVVAPTDIATGDDVNGGRISGEKRGRKKIEKSSKSTGRTQRKGRRTRKRRIIDTDSEDEEFYRLGFHF